ncbi:MAG: hypothetical protein JW915_04535 [Chitinispirillaceae bacterium]|nr:hypothetical protein [Chitinispirillaceae bacterium]
MLRRVTLFLSIVTGLAFGAQTINLHGIVKNKAGNPIEGAIVTLAKQPLKDTTDSKGEYKLMEGVSVLPLLVPKTQSVTLNSNILEISLPDPSPVKVEIFDVKGKLLQKDIMQNAQSGFYRLNVAEISNTGNLLVIKATIGKELMTFRYVPLKNGNYSVKSAIDNSVFSGSRLKKVAATINDTLKVSANKFVSQSIPITNYVQEKDITLDSVPDGVVVQLDQEKQTIQGFGINAALMPTSSTLPWDELFKLEGSNDALGLSILRIGMSTGGGLNGVPNGWEKARTNGAKIIGSCWSAPANWKDNNRTDRGGHLLPNYRAQWATRIADFAKQYNLYAMSIANESDFASCKGNPVCTDDYETMVYTAEEMVEFVKVAGPIFKSKAPNVKMIAPEASEWVHVWSTASGTGSIVSGHPHSSDPLGCKCFSNEQDETGCEQKCLDGKGYAYGRWLAKDTEAWNAFDILGVHQYDSQKAYPWPADVTGGVRTKEVWQTEMSGVMHWPEQGPSTDIKNGVAVGRWIQSALMVGEASAWCWWWYGPPYYTSDDNEGLALVKGKSEKAKRYYTMGNYSRYIRPGHKVVNIAGTDKLPAKVLLTASKDDAGKVVIVAVNETTSEQTVPITIAGGTVPGSFTPYVTADGNKNWAEGSAVATSGSVLTVKLEKMSVTTFVSK